METKKTTLKKISLKKKEKLDLQSMLGLKVDKKTFLISICTNINEENNGDIAIEAIKACLEVGIQVIVCSQVNKKYDSIMEMFLKDYPSYFMKIDNQGKYQELIHIASDSELFLHDNNSVNTALENGCIPISVEIDTLDNANSLAETGNSFLIEKMNLWNIFATIIKARENFYFPYDWENLQKNCIESELLVI